MSRRRRRGKQKRLAILAAAEALKAILQGITVYNRTKERRDYLRARMDLDDRRLKQSESREERMAAAQEEYLRLAQDRAKRDDMREERMAEDQGARRALAADREERLAAAEEKRGVQKTKRRGLLEIAKEFGVEKDELAKLYNLVASEGTDPGTLLKKIRSGSIQVGNDIIDPDEASAMKGRFEATLDAMIRNETDYPGLDEPAPQMPSSRGEFVPSGPPSPSGAPYGPGYSYQEQPPAVGFNPSSVVDMALMALENSSSPESIPRLVAAWPILKRAVSLPESPLLEALSGSVARGAPVAMQNLGTQRPRSMTVEDGWRYLREATEPAPKPTTTLFDLREGSMGTHSPSRETNPRILLREEEDQ